MAQNNSWIAAEAQAWVPDVYEQVGEKLIAALLPFIIQAGGNRTTAEQMVRQSAAAEVQRRLENGWVPEAGYRTAGAPRLPSPKRPTTRPPAPSFTPPSGDDMSDYQVSQLAYRAMLVEMDEGYLKNNFGVTRAQVRATCPDDVCSTIGL